MKKILSIFAFVSLLASITAISSAWADIGGVKSLRGSVELESINKAEELKRVPRDLEPYARDYLHQPPLIPHQIRGYKIDLNSNKCISCHSWQNYKKSGATKISMTHFDTRDGQQLSDVSPRRYFCNQCHVPQADAKPLVDNTFNSVKPLEQ